MITASLLLKLAQTYCDGTGMSLESLSKLVTGKKTHTLFTRLRDGKGCSTSSLDRAVRWLDEHWPAQIEWPADVLRGPPLKAPTAQIVTSWGEPS